MLRKFFHSCHTQSSPANDSSSSLDSGKSEISSPAELQEATECRYIFCKPTVTDFAPKTSDPVEIEIGKSLASHLQKSSCMLLLR